MAKKKGINSFGEWKQAGGRKGYAKRLSAQSAALKRGTPISKIKKAVSRVSKKIGRGAAYAATSARDIVNEPLEMAFRSKMPRKPTRRKKR